MLKNILEYLRVGLYIILAVIGYNLYQEWGKTQQAKSATISGTNAPSFVAEKSFIDQQNSLIVPINSSPEGKIIHVTTDTLGVDIDSGSGNIVGVNLLKYPSSLNSTNPYVLLNQNKQTFYVATSGTVNLTNPSLPKVEAVIYQADATQYQLADNQDEVVVKLHGTSKHGIKINKEFIFRRNSYLVNLRYDIHNTTGHTWVGGVYNELTRTNFSSDNNAGIGGGFSTYFGAAISSPEKAFDKISFKDMTNQNLRRDVTGGWAAMVQHYFVSAWIPQADQVNEYYSKVSDNGLYTIGVMSSTLSIPPNSQKNLATKLYTGPSLTDALAQAAPGLQLTIDYGSFWIISVAIFWLLAHIQHLIGNWGWSIVLTTILIKLLFYQLSAKSYRSMSMLKKIQPKIDQLKELHANDKQKLTQAIMELYRKEKINPMSGCLPMIIQIPVFIALYWVLVESVQLRHAPFMLWIHDLTAKDPFYVLPVLVGCSMLLQQWLSPPPPDATQAKIMFLMPIVFTCLFISCPAGLMLYWFVNNLLSCLQQWYITRNIK